MCVCVCDHFFGSNVLRVHLKPYGTVASSVFNLDHLHVQWKVAFECIASECSKKKFIFVRNLIGLGLSEKRFCAVFLLHI